MTFQVAVEQSLHSTDTTTVAQPHVAVPVRFPSSLRRRLGRTKSFPPLYGSVAHMLDHHKSPDGIESGPRNPLPYRIQNTGTPYGVQAVGSPPPERRTGLQDRKLMLHVPTERGWARIHTSKHLDNKIAISTVQYCNYSVMRRRVYEYVGR